MARMQIIQPAKERKGMVKDKYIPSSQHVSGPALHVLTHLIISATL